MTRFSPAAIAVGAAAVLVLAIGAALLTRPGPSVGGPASPPPSLPPSPPPSPSALVSGQIALQRTVDGNTDLYLMNLDRSGLVRLTDDPAIDHLGSWSPDGKTLFFVRGSVQDPDESDIYALDIESGDAVQLTNDPGVEGGPIVSPDGSQIAFDAWPNEPGIHMMDIDGSNRRRVSSLADDTYVTVGWNADGTGIYQIRSAAQIMLLDVATGVVSPIAIGGDENMALSPDGSTFAYQGDEADPTTGIYLMNADGSNVRHLEGSGTKSGPLTWAPDGQQIAFSYTDGWLYLIGVDGSELTQWAEGDSALWRPAP